MCKGGAFASNNADNTNLIGRPILSRRQESCFGRLPVDLLTVRYRSVSKEEQVLSRGPGGSRACESTHVFAPARFFGAPQDVSFGSRLVLFVAVIALATWNAIPASAATALSVDEPNRGIQIRVEADAPDVLELRSDGLLPIRWNRQGVRETTLPAIAVGERGELSIVDNSGVVHSLRPATTLPRILIDPARYARDAAWRGQPSLQQRVRYLGLGVLFSLGLLLVLLIRRNALLAATLYCLAWACGLAVALANRPSLIWSGVHPEVPIMRLYAREGQPVRVPINVRSGLCIPIVESVDHLRALSIRVEVRGDEAELVADLPSGSKLYLTSVTYADRLLENPNP